MKKVFALLAAVIFSASVVFAAPAQKESAGNIKPRSTYMAYNIKLRQYKDQLDLNQKQKESINKLDEDLKNKQKALRQQISSLNGEKNAAIEKKNFAKAKENAASIAKLEGDVEKNNVDYIESVSKILTAAQYSKLDTLISNAAVSRRNPAARTNPGQNQKGKTAAQTKTGK